MLSVAGVCNLTVVAEGTEGMERARGVRVKAVASKKIDVLPSGWCDMGQIGIWYFFPC
jgi:hypothetical protein